MKCTPRYDGVNREQTQVSCNDKCFHWKACLKELKLDDNFKPKTFYELPPTDAELHEGLFHISDGLKRTWKVEGTTTRLSELRKRLKKIQYIQRNWHEFSHYFDNRSQTEKEIADLYFAERLSYRKVARAINMSHESVRRVVVDMIDKL